MSSAPPRLGIELSRWLEAPVERIYRAFTEADSLQQWWGPRGFVIEEIDFAPRVGATYSVSLRAPDGSRFAHIGEFLEVDPPRAWSTPGNGSKGRSNR